MKRTEPVNTGIRDNVVIPGTDKDLRTGFPANVRINHADTTDNDGRGFVTFPIMVKNFEDTTYTHTFRYGEILMSRNHDHGKPIPAIYTDGTKIPSATFDSDTLSVVQVNSILHRDFVHEVEAIETLKYNEALKAQRAGGVGVPPNFVEGQWKIDYTDHTDLARKIGARWSLTGMCMTAPDIPINNEIHRHHTRMLVVAKRGATECINLWGREARSNDRVFLVLKMVEVKAATSYRTENMVCQNPGIPIVPNAVVSTIHYVPQYVAATSQYNTPSEATSSYVVMRPDNMGGAKFRAPYYLVGVIDVNRSVDKFRRHARGVEFPLVDTKVVYRNPEIYIHLFIS